VLAVFSDSEPLDKEHTFVVGQSYCYCCCCLLLLVENGMWKGMLVARGGTEKTIGFYSVEIEPVFHRDPIYSFIPVSIHLYLCLRVGGLARGHSFVNPCSSLIASHWSTGGTNDELVKAFIWIFRSVRRSVHQPVQVSISTYTLDVRRPTQQTLASVCQLQIPSLCTVLLFCNLSIYRSIDPQEQGTP
jgi:hypothetical protein